MELEFLKVNREGPEYVLFRVSEDTNLWQFIVFDTTYDEDGNPSNLNRHSFFFRNKNVSKGDYVVIYTLDGQDSEFKNKAGSITHVFYWGLDTEVWNNTGDRVLLVKVDEFRRFKI